ncbi:MAG TPA: hypothetical protein VGD84_22175 [Pseudonocardiaceae bacterium]
MSLRLGPRRLAVAVAVLSTVLALSAVQTANAAPGVHPHATCSTQFLPLPDPSCTPGVTNPDVTQATIGSTICKSGWTSTIRPPTSYTNPLKVQGIKDYGYSDTNLSDYEEDHFLPLEVGGAPRDPKNLWPEPHAGNQGSASKDGVENAVKRAVCNHTATLAAAQQAMLTDWTTAKAVLGIG